jgi:hypothetical protein
MSSNIFNLANIDQNGLPPDTFEMPDEFVILVNASEM